MASLLPPARYCTTKTHRGHQLEELTCVHYPAIATRLSISLRSATKSMSASAPPSRAFLLVLSSPYAVIMMTGTCGLG